MKTLVSLIAFVNASHMAWHEAFKIGVVCKWDGSLWVRWFVDSTLYEFPANGRDEALAMVGEHSSRDEGWRLL